MDDPDAGPLAVGHVRTVTGDVSAVALGACDYHDHLFQVSPLLAGEELDDEVRSGAEAARMARAGIGAMVEATPTGLGRQPGACARISVATGLHVVHVTGAHHQGHYPDGHPLLDETSDQLEKRFAGEVLTGLRGNDGCDNAMVTRDGAPVRAGMVKAGAGLWRISPFEGRVLDAAGATATATGVAVMVHLEHGSAAWEVLERLAAAGAPAHRVVLAHMDRNPDPGLHAELTAAGAYVGYDGMARHQYYPESTLISCLARTIERGGDASRVVMGADVARRSRFVEHGGMPGLEYLPLRFLPRLRRELGDELVDRIMVANPARLLAGAGADSNETLIEPTARP